MQSTQVKKRKINSLGKVHLPAKFRTELGIAPFDDVEMYVEGHKIVVAKYKPCCMFCGTSEWLIQFQRHQICISCRQEIQRMKNHD